MTGNNPLGAGRKPALTQEMTQMIRKRHKEGESVTALAKEYGVSRQTMSSYVNDNNSRKQQELDLIYKTYKKWIELNKEFRDKDACAYQMRMDYMWEDECCSVILVDFKSRKIEVVDKTPDVIHRAFGIKKKPVWKDFWEFLESRCFPRTRDHMRMILKDLGLDHYDPLDIVEKTKGRMAEDHQWIQIRYFRPTDMGVRSI